MLFKKKVHKYHFFHTLYFIILRSMFFNNSVIRMCLIIDVSSPSTGGPLAPGPFLLQWKPPPSHLGWVRSVLLACVLSAEPGLVCAWIENWTLSQASMLQAKVQNCVITQS